MNYNKKYRGFIRAGRGKDGKGSIDPFANLTSDQLPKYVDVKDHKSYGGVLAKGIIIVDVDEINEAETLLKIVDELNIKCDVMRTTKGMHFYFKTSEGGKIKNASKICCALGLEIDVKCGNNNSYAILKLNGVKREWIRTVDELDELPKWLKQIPNSPHLFGLKEGSGRNDLMYKNIPRLQSYGLSKDEIIYVYGLVNKYILGTPFETTEFTAIVREDAFKDEKELTKKPKLSETSTGIIKDLNLVYYQGNYYYWDEFKYIKDNDEARRHLLLYYYPEATRSYILDVEEQVRLRIAQSIDKAPSKLVSFNNGVYDIETCELSEPNNYLFFPNHIDWNYDATAYSEIMDDFINTICCNNWQVRRLLLQMIGYLFYSRNELRKCFFLKGKGRNGKSTLLKVCSVMLGYDNISTISLDQIEEGGYEVPSLSGKLANFGDDIEGSYITKSATLKKLVSGDPIFVRAIYGKPYEMRPYCKMIFSCNEMPTFKDKSHAMDDRVIIIPLDAEIDNPNPTLIDDLVTPTAIEYLIRIALEEFKSVLINDKFDVPEIVEAEKQKYRDESDIVLMYVTNKKDNSEPIINHTVKTIYAEFKVWAEEEGYEKKYIPQRKNFVIRICDLIGCEVAKKADQNWNYSPTFIGKEVIF